MWVELLFNDVLIHRYLEHSILALNTSNEVTRSHMLVVLSSLCQLLQQAEELLNLTSPNTARKLRKLHMVAKRLAQPFSHRNKHIHTCTKIIKYYDNLQIYHVVII